MDSGPVTRGQRQQRLCSGNGPVVMWDARCSHEPQNRDRWSVHVLARLLGEPKSHAKLGSQKPRRRRIGLHLATGISPRAPAAWPLMLHLVYTWKFDALACENYASTYLATFAVSRLVNGLK